MIKKWKINLISLIHNSKFENNTILFLSFQSYLRQNNSTLQINTSLIYIVPDW